MNQKLVKEEIVQNNDRTDDKMEMIFNSDCVQSSIKLFMFPGEYAVDFIFDQDFQAEDEFNFCFEMKYNLENTTEYVEVEEYNQKINYVDGTTESQGKRVWKLYKIQMKKELNNLITEYKEKMEDTQIDDIKCDANSPDSDTCEFFKIQLFVILEKYLRSFNKNKNISSTNTEEDEKLKKSLRYISSKLTPLGQILYEPPFTERPQQPTNLMSYPLISDYTIKINDARRENNLEQVRVYSELIEQEVIRIQGTMPVIRTLNNRKDKITMAIDEVDNNIEKFNELENNVFNFYDDFLDSPPPGISRENENYFSQNKSFFLDLIKSFFENSDDPDNPDESELNYNITNSLEQPGNLIQSSNVDVDSLKTFYTYINDNRISSSSGNLSFSIMSLIDNYFYIILRNFGITRNTNNFPSISGSIIQLMERGLGGDNTEPAPIHSGNQLNVLLKTINVKIEPKDDIHETIPGTDIPFDSPIFSVEEEEPLDSYTIDVRKILNSLKTNINNIITTKIYNSGDMSLELENSLKDIHKKSNNDFNQEESNIYTNIVAFVRGLMDKISTGRVDYIQTILGLNTDEYIYNMNTPTESKINEILNENFSNYRVEEEMNRINNTNKSKKSKTDTIETFANWHNSLHKHTSRGTIDSNLTFNLNTQSGRELIQDQSLISEASKSQLTNSYKNMEQTLLNASNKVDEFIQLIDQKNNTFDYDKLDSDKENIRRKILEKRRQKEEENYKNKEAEQKLKRESIELKLKELEDIQGKKYLGEQDSYNSIKSYDNQEIISVNNLKDDVYNVLVNGKCLEYSKNKNGEIIKINDCNKSNKNQNFRINTIKNYDDYNNKMPNIEEELKATKYDPIKYPFYLLNPVQYSSQCLSLNGNNVGVTECYKTKKQRWEGLKSIKNCEKL